MLYTGFSVSKLQGLELLFTENFWWNLTYYESDSFSNFSLHYIFKSENSGLLFSTKNSLTWEVN